MNQNNNPPAYDNANNFIAQQEGQLQIPPPQYDVSQEEMRQVLENKEKDVKKKYLEKKKLDVQIEKYNVMRAGVEASIVRMSGECNVIRNLLQYYQQQP